MAELRGMVKDGDTWMEHIHGSQDCEWLTTSKEKGTLGNVSILGGGKKSPKRNIKTEGDPRESSVQGSKSLQSFKNENKDSSVTSDNEVCKNAADKCSLDLALWVVSTWGPLFQWSSGVVGGGCQMLVKSEWRAKT